MGSDGDPNREIDVKFLIRSSCILKQHIMFLAFPSYYKFLVTSLLSG